MKKTKIFTINIWNFIDIESLNEKLDATVDASDKLENVPTEIDYEIKKINKDGEITLKATYLIE